MNEQRNLLTETVERVFADLMTGINQVEYDSIAKGSLPAALWQAIEENGIASVMVPEATGGFGGGWEDAAVVFNRTGSHALPLPVAETLLAHFLLARAGIDIPAGPIGIAAATGIRLDRDGRISGSCNAVPWANAVPRLLVACEASHIALIETSKVHIANTSRNVAGEPLADVRFDAIQAVAHAPVDLDLHACGALLRAAQMAGALSTALRLSVEYANERVQFGKPIGKLQAIQQSLAVFADEVAAVNCAALSACRAADCGNANFEIAAAKLRANRAVGPATSIAHQVHGAIGFTREYKLHGNTQRLMAWRSEYGNDRYWAGRLGAMVAQRGADNFWPDLTARSDPG